MDACRDMANRKSNEAYLRLHFLCLAEAGANGHAPFPRGHLARWLGKQGKRYRNVDSAIAKAVSQGLLDPNSHPECLILPPGLVDMHDPTLAGIPCETCNGKVPPLVTASCHPDRKHYAGDLCKSCYEVARRNQMTPTGAKSTPTKTPTTALSTPTNDTNGALSEPPTSALVFDSYISSPARQEGKAVVGIDSEYLDSVLASEPPQLEPMAPW